MTLHKKGSKRGQRAVTLKDVASHLGVAVGTVSAVLNESPASRSIPPITKNRIVAAARELNYRPNLVARSLRVKRTFTIGIIAEQIGDTYSSRIISGIEPYLRKNGYFFLVVAHRCDPKLLESYSHLVWQRGAEGYITIDTPLTQPLPLPTVAVPGHRRIDGVTNMVLDHDRAALLALQHLISLGHRDIAVMRGPLNSSDSVDRYEGICRAARDLHVRIPPELTIQLESDAATSPENINPYMEEFLSRKVPFTALFAYHDNCAIGAIHMLLESGLRVPEDISIVGFDDMPGASCCNPTLTTVRQPLERMGEIAARTLLNRIDNHEECIPEIVIEPEFVVRRLTGRAPLGLSEKMASN